MLPMFVTFAVLNDETSKVVRVLQPRNIQYMLVTLRVSSFDRLIDSTFVKE